MTSQAADVPCSGSTNTPRVKSQIYNFVAPSSVRERPDQSNRRPSEIELKQMAAAISFGLDRTPASVAYGTRNVRICQLAQIRAYLASTEAMASMWDADRKQRLALLIDWMTSKGVIVPVDGTPAVLGPCVRIIDLDPLSPRQKTVRVAHSPFRGFAFGSR